MTKKKSFKAKKKKKAESTRKGRGGRGILGPKGGPLSKRGGVSTGKKKQGKKPIAAHHL